jgi:hypothetical protein
MGIGTIASRARAPELVAIVGPVELMRLWVKLGHSVHH